MAMNEKPYNTVVVAGGLVVGYIFANTGKTKPTLAKSAAYAALGAAGGLALMNVIRKARQ